MGKKRMEGNERIKERGQAWGAVLHSVGREAGVDKGMASKEKPEGRKN